MSMSTTVASIPPAIIRVGGVSAVAGLVKQFGGDTAFLITDKGLTAAGLTGQVTKIFDEAGIPCVVYDEVSGTIRRCACSTISGDSE